MNLATRCPDCGTVFRVVEDQLKVSDGWVRCGRCSAVFDARITLFGLDDLSAGTGSRHVPSEETGAVDAPLRPDAATPAAGEPSSRREDRTGAEPSVEADSLGPWPEPPPVPERVVAEAAGATSLHAADVPQAGAEDSSASQEAPLADATPGFLIRAERAERWRTPRMRARLALVAVLLSLVLVLQMALHYRDLIAARWPTTRPALHAACERLNCTVQAPRLIDSLRIESSSLARDEANGAYRLQIVLRNRAATQVRMPAIELALTDGQGQTLVRRVLSAAELGNGTFAVPAGGEVLLQASLDAGAMPVAGYSVEPFYP